MSNFSISKSNWRNNILTSPQGWGDVPVGKLLAAQTWGSELEFQKPHKPDATMQCTSVILTLLWKYGRVENPPETIKKMVIVTQYTAAKVGNNLNEE